MLPPFFPGDRRTQAGSAGLYWRLTRGHRKGIALAILTFVGVGGLGLLPPKVFGLLVDSVSGASSSWTPTVCALAYIGVSILQSVLRYPQRLCFARSSMEAASDLRVAFGDRLLAVPIRTLEGRSTGELVTRSTSDLQSVEAALSTGLAFLVGSLFHLLAVPVALFYISPLLCGLSLTILCPIPLLVHRRISRIVAESEATQESLGRLSARAQENRTALQTIRAFGLEEWQIARFGDASADYSRKTLTSSWMENALATGVQILVSLGTFAILLAGGRRVLEGDLTVGDFVAFSQYAGMLVWPLMGLSWAAVLFRKGEAALRRLYAVIDLAPPDPLLDQCLHTSQGRLEVRKLTFSHNSSESPTLSECSFSVSPGEKIAILGPTGSGKSTLVELLIGTIEPPAGTVFLDGRDVSTLSRDEVRCAFAVVPQEPFLFAGTIRTNVTLGAAEIPVSSERVEAACRAARLQVGVLPNGLETSVLSRGTNLSGGQRQRTTLARALLRPAPILVMDDATSGLDATTEEEIFLAIEALMPRRTLILVTQRVRPARTADRIIVLDGGRVAEEGSHDELMRAAGVYAAYVSRQDPANVIDNR